MRFSTTTLVIAAMLLLVAALVLLAFVVGNHYAASNLRTTLSSAQPNNTSTLAKLAPQTATKPPLTLPTTPRTDQDQLDTWLRGTILRAAPLSFGTEVTLALHDTQTPRGAVSEKNEIYLYFVDVVYDSRCPENVDCYTAGDAIVEVQVKTSDKPTQTIYLSSRTGGKPDAWTYQGITDDSFLTPIVKEEIARGQQRVTETTYTTGDTYNDGAALIDGYRIGLRSLTPHRVLNGENTPPIAKDAYRASFIVTPIQ